MKFISLSLNNFLSFKELDIDFTAYKGIVGIFGDNGAGKSSIFEAVYWCITGKTLRQRLPADCVVNNIANKDCFVRLVFEKNKIQYIITRYRKHSKYDNMLFFGTLEDEKKLTKTTNKDTQDIIYKVLGLQLESVERVYFFASNNILPLVEMTDGEIKSLIEDVLGFKIIDEYVNILNTYKKKYDPLINGYQNQILKLNTLIAEKEKQLVSAKNEIRRLVLESAYRIKKMKSESFIDIEEYQLKKKQIQDKLHKIYLQQDNANKLKIELDNARKERRNIELMYSKLETKILEDKNELNKLSNYTFPEACENCGRPYSVRSLQKSKRLHKNKINELKKKIASVEKDIKIVSKELDKYNNIVNDLEEKYNTLIEFISQKNIYLEQMKHIEAMIANAEKQNKILSEQKDYYRQIINNKRQERNQIKLGVNSLKNELKNIKKEYNEIYEEYNILQELTYILGNYGVKDIYLDNIFPFLNEIVIEYISSLGDIDIVFEKKKSKNGNKFNINVINHNGAQNYYGNSAGEKTKINLASSLAFQTFLREYLQIETNVLFLDEPFETLSETNSEAVINLLKKVSESVETIFLISHNDNIRDIVDNSLFVTKNNKISTITN